MGLLNFLWRKYFKKNCHRPILSHVMKDKGVKVWRALPLLSFWELSVRMHTAPHPKLPRHPPLVSRRWLQIRQLTLVSLALRGVVTAL